MSRKRKNSWNWHYTQPPKIEKFTEKTSGETTNTKNDQSKKEIGNKSFHMRQMSENYKTWNKDKNVYKSMDQSEKIRIEQKLWYQQCDALSNCIDSVNMNNCEIVLSDLSKIDILKARGLFARKVIQKQLESPQLTTNLAFVVSKLNLNFPLVIELLLKRIILKINSNYKNGNYKTCFRPLKFILQIYLHGIIDSGMILDLIRYIYKQKATGHIELVGYIFKVCDKKLIKCKAEEMITTVDDLIKDIDKNDSNNCRTNDKTKSRIKATYLRLKSEIKFKDLFIMNTNHASITKFNGVLHNFCITKDLDEQIELNSFNVNSEHIKDHKKFIKLNNDMIVTPPTTVVKQEALTIKQICFSIKNSKDAEECFHTLISKDLNYENKTYICKDISNQCAQEKTFRKFYSHLAQLLCTYNNTYSTILEHEFKDFYITVHRFDCNQLSNLAQFYAHLLSVNSISWHVFSCINLNERDTTSSSRVYLKCLLTSLSVELGLTNLQKQFSNRDKEVYLDGLLPKENREDTLFAVCFFKFIGLGDLVKHLTDQVMTEQILEVANNETKTRCSSSTTSLSSTSSSLSSDSLQEKKKKKKRKKHKSKKIAQEKKNNSRSVKAMKNKNRR